VDWNGGERTTTYKSSTSLQAAITTEDIATAGTAAITVTTFGANGGIVTSSPVNFTISPSSMSSSAAKFPQVVSVSSIGGPANGASESPAISADGRYVAFYSQAKNLVAQGVTRNIFVRDTCVGAINCIPKTTSVDVAADGAAPNGKTGRQVAISGDGRFVGFISRATNLISSTGAGAPPGYWELYVRDLCTGANAPSGCVPRTEMISLGADGSAADAPSASPSISGDGRYVAFVSSGKNLTPDSPILRPQVYIRDTCAGPTGTKSCIPRTVSIAADDLDRIAGSHAGRPAISADGRYVSFEIWAGLATQNLTGSSEVVLADACLGLDAPVSCAPSTERISFAPDGSLLRGANISPSISGDGRFVVFESQPTDSNGGNASGISRAALRDTCFGATAPDGCTPSTTLISVDIAGSTARPQSFSPAISASGRYISFVSGGTSGTALSDDRDEGSLVVRDTCFGAMLPCTPHSYAISAPSTDLSDARTASVNLSRSAGLSKMSPIVADKYSAAPITADGHLTAFYAPDTVVAEPASGIGDVYLTVTPF
jgi:Tol biopolymer transport system component